MGPDSNRHTEERGGHLGVAEDGRPFADGKISRQGDQGSLVNAEAAANGEGQDFMACAELRHKYMLMCRRSRASGLKGNAVSLGWINDPEASRRLPP